MVRRRFRVILDGEVYEVEVEVEEGLGERELLLRALERAVIREERSFAATKQLAPSMPGAVESPISGRVVEVRVGPGDEVRPDTVVVVLESMKTQVEVRAGRRGKVKEVLVKEGDAVRQGEPLLRLTAA